MRTPTRKQKLVAATAAATLVVGGGLAYAYWTTTGSGTGSADAATSNGTVTLHASFADGIHPGGSQAVSFTADNAGESDLYVGTINLASVSVDAGHASCDVADFSMADVVSDTTVLHGASGQSVTGTGTLGFANDPAHSQDACKGATVTLHLTSN